MEGKSIFQTLSEVDITPKIKKKQNLSYLPWSSAWEIIKIIYPTATYKTIKSDTGCIYHTDGKTCWVETELVICDEIQNETLPVLDYKNKSVTYETVTSSDVNKSIKRCLTKNAALFGLGLSLWVGEELSDAAKNAKNQKTEEERRFANALKAKKNEIVDLAKKKIASGVAKTTVYNVIGKNNEGNLNPNSIETIEICDVVIEEINKLEKEIK